MRKILFLVWLLVPVGLIYFHYGPGQKYKAIDRAMHWVEIANDLSDIAQQSGKPEDWQKVIVNYDKALAVLEDKDDRASERLNLARSHAMVYQGELFEAIGQLEQQLIDVADKKMEEKFQDEVRDTLARAQFGAAWVMRLEGADTDLWMEQAEKARQNFRLLAEQNLQTDQLADEHQKNLEATIRMERMDASVIKGIPLPPEAQNGQGKGLSDKMKAKKGEGEGEPGIGESEEGDARDGANSLERPQGIGS
ncbi:MAG: hypothetical protein JEZ07_13795 [Phycisphaerae bacterium]|nr:hypothetical protein [Phycisphaerae bacterium]